MACACYYPFAIYNNYNNNNNYYYYCYYYYYKKINDNKKFLLSRDIRPMRAHTDRTVGRIESHSPLVLLLTLCVSTYNSSRAVL